jgi:hypothetical protein
VYRLTDAGRVEVHDWLTELISTPVRDYPAFEAALSFLPALPPEQVVTLLEERARQLAIELAQAAATRELAEKSGLPRLVWVEHEFESVLREAELGYVHDLIRDIESGALEGMQWWRQIHERDDDAPIPPPPHSSDPPAYERDE